MKSESPGWSSIPGENSFASDYSGEEDDGGTYLYPASAINHPILHLVYTSAYEGNDCTGSYWASAEPGNGVAMRIVERAADTAVDPPTDGDEDDSLSPTADYDSGDAGVARGTDDVGPCPHRVREDPDNPVTPPFPPGGRKRSFPGIPVGPRETARYGLRGKRLGEASHPGPSDPGDREYVLRAARVAARVAHVDAAVAAMQAEYQALQTERFGFAGAHTPGDPARGAPPRPPPAASQFGTPWERTLHLQGDHRGGGLSPRARRA